jgi:prepilin-type N-terminal cleavage/methylation domain-containing protein
VTKQPRSEAGYTLTEVIVAVVIMSVAIGAVLAAMSAAILGSRVHGDIVTSDQLVRAYGENLLSSAVPYTDCAAAPTPSVPSVYSAMSGVPTGFVVRIVSIEYGDAANPTGYGNTHDQCTQLGDKGVQRITLESHRGAAGSTTGTGQQTLQIVKRKS